MILHIPGVEETEAKNLQPTNIDLVIFHQSPDKRGRTRDLFQKFATSKTSLFVVVGQQTDLTLLAQLDMPLNFEVAPRQYDDVMPIVNPSFPYFLVSPEANSVFASFPRYGFRLVRCRFRHLPLRCYRNAWEASQQINHCFGLTFPTIIKLRWCWAKVSGSGDWKNIQEMKTQKLLMKFLVNWFST